MTSTINKEEIQKFSKLADEWWDVNGKFKPLHMFNPIRIQYITSMIKQHFKIKSEETPEPAYPSCFPESLQINKCQATLDEITLKFRRLKCEQ